MLRIEVACADRDQLGEGPLWDVDEQCLYWINSYGPAIHRMEPSGAKKTWRLPEPGIRLDGSSAERRRDPVAAQRIFFDFTTGEAKRICETQPGELRPRLNDGKSDRQGRFVAGSMDFEERDLVGKLFRLDPDLSVHTLDEEIIFSNGPCWSPDGRTLYFADTGRRAIYAYDYDTSPGRVRSRRVFARFDPLRGLPDGATVDAEGFVWSVEVYAGRLVRFDPWASSIASSAFRSSRRQVSPSAAPISTLPLSRRWRRPMGGQYQREARRVGCSRCMALACAACRSHASPAEGT